MSDSKLFSLEGDQAHELTGSTASLERDLRQQIEANISVPIWGISYPK
ncbi:hypothetical protein [Oleiphilus messinensis]|nr:hypothetical protein [Oleiphilus messinensis]